MGSNDAIDVEGRWGFFANGTASSVDRDPSARVSGFEADLSGATLGLDYRVTSAWVLGGAVGYEENDSELDFDGGSVDNETLTFSLQTSWFSGKSAWFEAIAGMGQTDIDQSRGIRYALPGVIVDSIAVGSTESDQTFASIATGWDFAPGAFAISPEIRFDYLSADVDAFEETVTGINDLGRGLGIAYDAQDFSSITGQVGVQIGYNVSTSWGVIVPQVNLSFIREFDDGADTVQGGFLGDSLSESYTLLNDDADTSYGQVGAGAVFVTRSGRSFYVFYDQLVSHEFLEIQTFNVGLRLGF
jgi:outer membrane autotransporter protein